ncbi:MAG: hypothetical protein WC318_07100 [Candidatus Omnitrophota bacterium]|jgi:hypothetical protein
MTKNTEEQTDAPEATGVKLDEWMEEWVKRYMTIWRKAYSLLPAGMKDEDARAGAINGMMIGAERHGLLKAMPISIPVPPTPVSERKAEEPAPPKEEPKKEPGKATPPAEKQTALPEDGIPTGTDGKPLPPYDRNKPGWNYCPLCKNRNITHPKNKPKTGDYQACWECRVWLPVDKDRPKPMEDGGEK